MAPSDTPLKRANGANGNAASQDLSMQKSSGTSRETNYIEMQEPPEADFDLEQLMTGELVKLIGQRTVRMHEIAEKCSHNLLHTRQTEATLRMLSRVNNEATKLFFQGAEMIQSIKIKPSFDHVVKAQIQKEKSAKRQRQSSRTVASNVPRAPRADTPQKRHDEDDA